MIKPYKSIAICIIAMLITFGVGSVMQTTHATVEKTTTTYKGDLTPSVQYESINDWTLYNPLNNVTGWNPASAITTMPPGVANQYLVSPSTEGYDEGVATITVMKNLPKNATRLDIPGATYNKLAITESSEWGVPLMGWISSSQIVDGPAGYVGGEVGYANTNSLNNLTLSTNYIWGGYGQEYRVDQPHGSYSGFWGSLAFIGNVHLNNGTTIPFGCWGNGYNTHENNQCYIIPLSEYSFPAYEDGMVIHSDENISLFTQNYSQNVSITSGGTYHHTWRIDEEITETTYKDWIYSVDTQSWYPAEQIGNLWQKIDNTTGYPFYSKTGQVAKGLCIVRYDISYNVQNILGSNISEPINDISYGLPIVLNPTYADPTKFVSIAPNTNVTWINNEKNGIIHLLGTKNIQITPYSAYNQISDVTITIPQDIPYDYVLITLDFVNKSFTCKGVLSSLPPTGDNPFNTLSYTTADYDYSLNVVYNVKDAKIPDKTERLQVFAGTDNLGNPANGYVYVVDTIVEVDPLGILWGNPSMNIQYYFPEQIKSDTRIIFNAFVKYGSSMTINADPDAPASHTFSVSDGKMFIKSTIVADINNLTVKLQPSNRTYSLATYVDQDTNRPYWQYIDGNNVTWTLTHEYDEDNNYIGTYLINSDKSVKYTMTSDSSGIWKYEETNAYIMKGMAIDYLHSGTTVNVSIVFTEDKNQRIDLGVLDNTVINTPTPGITTKAGYIVSATGNWYWQANLNDVKIENVEEIKFDWSNLFGLSLAGAGLLYIFIMILCVAVIRFVYPDEFGYADWLVIMIAGFFALIFTLS